MEEKLSRVEWITEELSWIRVVNGERTFRDFSWNGLGKIVKDGDISLWAVKSYLFHTDLLKRGIRWPNEFNTERDAPNRWLYYLLGFKNWTRPQKDMTRDPYYMLGACMYHLLKHKKDMPPEMAEDIVNAFKAAHLPWYIFNRLSYIIWRKRLLNDKRGDVAKHIEYFKKQATVWKYEVRDEDDFWQDRLI